LRAVAGAGIVVGLVLAATGCGDALDELNRLAARGAIHDGAPVTAHVVVRIAAPPDSVWAILVDAARWPAWYPAIASVSVGVGGPAAGGALGPGVRFVWRTGGTTIHSQVQLFEPPRRLAWTGSAMTARAAHVWELAADSAGGTTVTVRESMDGPLMSTFVSSSQLAETDNAWIAALKRAAERRSTS